MLHTYPLSKFTQPSIALDAALDAFWWFEACKGCDECGDGDPMQHNKSPYFDGAMAYSLMLDNATKATNAKAAFERGQGSCPTVINLFQEAVTSCFNTMEHLRRSKDQAPVNIFGAILPAREMYVRSLLGLGELQRREEEDVDALNTFIKLSVNIRKYQASVGRMKEPSEGTTDEEKAAAIAASTQLVGHRGLLESTMWVSQCAGVELQIKCGYLRNALQGVNAIKHKETGSAYAAGEKWREDTKFQV